MRNKRFAFCVFFAAGYVSTTAYAATSAADKEAAKQLYQLAAADMQREAYDRACPQFAAALQLDPQHVRTAISLGSCEERWGKFLSALQRFEHARTLAVAQSAAEKIVEIDGLIADLKHRIPRVRIIVPEHIVKLEGLTVIRNGSLVRSDQFGKAISLDPGACEVMASSPTSGVWRANVDLRPGNTAEVTVGGPSTATYQPNPVINGFSAVNESSMRSQTSAYGYRRGVGFAAIGLGVAGLVAGSVTGGLAISRNSASDDGHCDANSYCDSTGMTLRRDAQQYASVSTGLFIAGGVLFATGIILVATTPSKKTTTSLWLGPGNIGLRARW